MAHESCDHWQQTSASVHTCVFEIQFCIIQGPFCHFHALNSKKAVQWDLCMANPSDKIIIMRFRVFGRHCSNHKKIRKRFSLSTGLVRPRNVTPSIFETTAPGWTGPSEKVTSGGSSGGSQHSSSRVGKRRQTLDSPACTLKRSEKVTLI